MGSSYLPTLPNLPRILTGPALRWVEPPNILFPDLSEVSQAHAEHRTEYYVSLILCSGMAWLLLGTVVLAIVRQIAIAKQAKHVKGVDCDSWLETIKHRWTLAIIMAANLIANACLLFIAFRHETVDSTIGVGWEFWAAWINLGMFQGVVEVACLSYRPGPRPITLFSKAMVLNHLPLLSERMDTAKDLVFAVVVIHEGPAFLGCILGLWLIACHVYFAYNATVRVELMETWLPILTAGAETGKPFCEDMGHTLRMLVLKQVSPARQYIGLLEDVPQIGGILIFIVYHKTFVFSSAGILLFTFVVSLARVTLAFPPLQRNVYIFFVTPIRKDREEAAQAGNAPKVLALTRALWRVNRNEPATELQEVGWTVGQLMAEGFNPSQLEAAGFELSQLKAEGFEYYQLHAAGFSMKQIVAAGFDASHLKAVGYGASQLKGLGFNASQLQEAGFDADQLKAAGTSEQQQRFNASQLREAGFNASQLKAEGFNASELKEANFSILRLKDAGFNASQLKVAGFNASQLQDAGFATSQLPKGSRKVSSVHPEA